MGLASAYELVKTGILSSTLWSLTHITDSNFPRQLTRELATSTAQSSMPAYSVSFSDWPRWICGRARTLKPTRFWQSNYKSSSQFWAFEPIFQDRFDFFFAFKSLQKPTQFYTQSLPKIELISIYSVRIGLISSNWVNLSKWSQCVRVNPLFINRKLSRICTVNQVDCTSL